MNEGIHGDCRSSLRRSWRVGMCPDMGALPSGVSSSLFPLNRYWMDRCHINARCINEHNLPQMLTII